MNLRQFCHLFIYFTANMNSDSESDEFYDAEETFTKPPEHDTILSSGLPVIQVHIHCLPAIF